MFDWVRTWLLRALRVPPEPEPPFGDRASIRVFRASRKFYWLRLLWWGGGQLAVLIVILFWAVILVVAERAVAERRAARQAAAQTASDGTGRQDRRSGTSVKDDLKRGQPRLVRSINAAVKPVEDDLKRGQPLRALVNAVSRMPPQAFALLWIAKAVGLIAYLGQLLITYAAQRLDYEMRWYVVTDRSLRMRTGLWKVQEMTMSFANLQQVMLSQGPVQRLLGIADVHVQSAGGGGASEGDAHGHEPSMHTGIFHGVDNATEVRDLILNRFRQFREAGLGDPDDLPHTPAQIASPAASGAADLVPQADVLAAARELREEARQLRCKLQLLR